MTQKEMINWVNKANLVELLSKWRLSPPGDPFFADKVVADLYSKRMADLRAADPGAWVAASKAVGW